jgi:hypothetical protein
MPQGPRFVDNSMGDFIGLCAIVIVALSPLLRCFYIDRFCVHARGTALRLKGGFHDNPDAAGAWVWTPIIEYHTTGQRFTSAVSCWQRVIVALVDFGLSLRGYSTKWHASLQRSWSKDSVAIGGLLS